MSILDVAKSVVKKIPPIQTLISERDELRSQVSKLNQELYHRKAYPSLKSHKLDLIDYVFASQKTLSFADLGGVGIVDGGYTFYTLDKYKPSKAVLVDGRSTDRVLAQSKRYRQMKFVEGDFSDKRIAEEVGQVDVIFLFAVLLHQVAPDWDEVLDIYAPLTQCFIVFNQQWVGTDSTIRLLDLGEDEYFQNVPHSKERQTYSDLFLKLDQKHPKYNKLWRDIPNIWQWGITDVDLQEKFKSLGFHLQYYKNCGPFGNLKNFEDHAFVFSE